MPALNGMCQTHAIAWLEITYAKDSASKIPDIHSLTISGR